MPTTAPLSVWRRLVALGLALTSWSGPASAVTAAAIPVAGLAPATVATGGSRFLPLDPVRIVDTRDGTATAA